MTNKIPPPILTVVAIIGVFILAVKTSYAKLYFPGQVWAGYFIASLGLSLLLYAGLMFKNAGTTVNPFKPEATSDIVDQGLYAISRNPMYLAMALTIFGIVIRMGSWLGLIPLLAFIAYITAFQIKPEEVALEAKFGQDYLDYKARVRRWI